MELKDMKKNNQWVIEVEENAVAEKIGYKKMIEYCEILSLAGVKNIVVQYLGEDKVYIFDYDFDLETVFLVNEEEY